MILGLAAPVLAQQAPAAAPPVVAPATLSAAQLRAALDAMAAEDAALPEARAEIAALRDRLAQHPTAGATLEALANRLLAEVDALPPPPDRAGLEALIDRGELRAAEAEMRRHAGPRAEALRRIAGLNEYIEQRARTADYARRLATIVSANDIARPLDESIAQLERRVAADEQRCDRSPEPNAELDELQSLYRRAYPLAIQAAADAAEKRPVDDFPAVTRTAACRAPIEPLISMAPAPASGTQGQGGTPAGARPRLDLANSAPTSAYYPPTGRLLQLEGSAVVRAFVAADGCATRAQLLVTSGEPTLDEAALRWALDGAVFVQPVPLDPARGERERATSFKVTFTLTD